MNHDDPLYWLMLAATVAILSPIIVAPVVICVAMVLELFNREVPR